MREGPAPARWRLRTEAPIALAVGCVVGVSAFTWYANFYLGGAVTTDDLLDYCSAVAALSHDRPEAFPAKRALLPALPPWLLEPYLGVFDALLASAVVGTALCGAGLYLWGSALVSRLAGVAAAASMLTMAPMAMQARMPSFYATINGLLALSASLTTAAVRTSRPVHHAAASTAIGLALLADVRSLVWALPFVGTLLASVALVRGPSRGARLVAIFLPLAISHGFGTVGYPENAVSLEEQLDVRPLFHMHGSRTAEVLPPYEYESGYVWGRTPVRQIPATIATLIELSRVEPPSDVRMNVPASFHRHHVQPWLSTAAIVLPLSLVVVARRRRRLVAALLGTGAPYLVALWGQQHMVEPQARFLTQSLPVVALGLGVSFAWIISSVPAPGGRHGRIRSVVGLAIVLVIATGILPTPLSPAAGWRMRWRPDTFPLAQLDRDLRLRPGRGRLKGGAVRCVEAIRADHAEGHPKYSRWLDVRAP